MGKSVFLTYIFWAVGGWFGLHHFYLGRDSQAFIWWTLVGGYGGVGLFVDFFRIPRYVEEASFSEGYIAKFLEYIKEKPKPPFSLYRFIGQVAFGNLLSWVTFAAIPEQLIMGISLWWFVVLVPLGSALGVYIVGNVGREEGSIRNALLASYFTLPFYTMENPKYYWSSVLAALAFRTQVKWRRTPPKKKGLCKRVLVLSACGCLYLSLWTSFLYFNMVITNEHGETIHLRDAISNLLKSPMFMELRQSLYNLWQFYRLHGFPTLYNEFMKKLDPFGESNALITLDLPKGASQEQITKRWRDLSRQWHPDKFRDPEEKAVAQEKFMEIKDAFDKLSVIHAKRKEQRSKSEDIYEPLYPDNRQSKSKSRDDL